MLLLFLKTLKDKKINWQKNVQDKRLSVLRIFHVLSLFNILIIKFW